MNIQGLDGKLYPHRKRTRRAAVYGWLAVAVWVLSIAVEALVRFAGWW